MFDNLSDAIFHFAEKRGDAAALHDGATTITYRELAILVGKAAVYLHDLGVRPGQLLGLSLPTNADHVILLFAAMRIGAVPVDIAMHRPATVDPFKPFGVERVLTAPGVAIAGATVHAIDAGWRTSIDAKRGDRRFAGPSDALIHFSVTSGSTGRPKGVITTQRQWCERFRVMAELFPDVITAERPPNLLALGEISFSPFVFFVAAQICVGGPIVLIGQVESVEALIEAINDWDQSAFLITPTTCRALLAKATAAGPLLPRVRALFTAGGPLFPQEKRAIAERVTPHFYELYGNSATSTISSLSAAEMAGKAESVGRVAPGTAVDIVDREGRPVAPGTIGHIRCRGPALSQRFHGPEQMTGVEGFRDGAFYPGDLGSFDDEGYLYLKGRVTDVIVRHGIEIYPAEIEAVLAAHPSVAEAAVIGLPGGAGEQEVIAVIVPSGDADLDAVARYCQAHLRPEKYPNRLFGADAIPKTGPGKVDRAAIRAHVVNALKSAKPLPGAAPGG